MNLVKAYSELVKEFVKLKEQGPLVTEAEKLKIIDKYKVSPELSEKVLS